MGPQQDQGPDPGGQDKMAKEVSVQITSDAAFAKTRLSGRERMQARRARHREWNGEVVETTTEEVRDVGNGKGPKEISPWSSPWQRRIRKFVGRQKL